MIDSVRLKFGPQPESPGLSFAPGAMTVFVGPKNSGKSLLIRELNAWLTMISRERRPPLITADVIVPIVADADYDVAARSAVREGLRRERFHSAEQPRYSRELESRVKRLFDTRSKNWTDAAWVVTANCSLLLGGDKRLQLTEQQDMGDLQLEPTNHLAALLKSRDRRRAAQSVIHEAFRRYFVFDPTNGGKIRIRLSDREPLNADVELSLTPEAIAFHGAADSIENSSDGVKAFVGIIAAAYSSTVSHT